MRARDSFADAVAAIWRLTETGERTAGDPLAVQDIAAAVGVSATPLREAMAWLCGQGLVERRPGRGYFMPAVSARAVADAYGLHRRYLLWSLESRGALPPDDRRVAASGDPTDLFQGLVAATRDSALVAAHRRAMLRLRQLRWAEPAPDPLEAAGLVEAQSAWARGDDQPIGVFIERYHAARIAAASDMASRLRGDAPNIMPI